LPHTCLHILVFPGLAKIFPREIHRSMFIKPSSSRKHKSSLSGVTWLLEGAPPLHLPQNHSSLLVSLSSYFFWLCSPCFYMDSMGHFYETLCVVSASCLFENLSHSTDHCAHPSLVCPSTICFLDRPAPSLGVRPLPYVLFVPIIVIPCGSVDGFVQPL
jgi:hypothetical protein